MSVLRILLYKYCFRFLIVGTFFIILSSTPINREYQLKAVFLLNFTHFIEWPSHSFANPEDPFIIGILGTDNFGKYLDEIVTNENVNGHPIVVSRFTSIENLNNCHILFISETQKMTEQIVPKLKKQNVLMVSDAPDFIQKGGIIKFITVDNKIKFQINQEAAKEAGLTISSKMLRLAEIVVPKNR